MNFDTHELAWAAGFFDGEGSVSLSRRAKRPELSLSVAQSDLSPLQRFHKAIGYIGKIAGPYKHKNSDHKPYWYIGTHGFQDTQAVIALLWKYLSEPKKIQATMCLCDALPYYRTRFLHGKGRAILTKVQAEELRANHAAAQIGRMRVPHGWIAEAARLYGVQPGTITSICSGHGYGGSKKRKEVANVR